MLTNPIHKNRNAEWAWFSNLPIIKHVRINSIIFYQKGEYSKITHKRKLQYLSYIAPSASNFPRGYISIYQTPTALKIHLPFERHAGFNQGSSEWVLSKFNGTSTPKGSYRAKTGDNDYKVIQVATA